VVDGKGVGDGWAKSFWVCPHLYPPFSFLS
jgi:hypothetical protein